MSAIAKQSVVKVKQKKENAVKTTLKIATDSVISIRTNDKKLFFVFDTVFLSIGSAPIFKK